MKFADVIINLPTNTLNQIFTYAIPDKFKGKIDFGYRVLVEFGHKNIEAYVIGFKNETDVKNVKNIIHVLDNRAVFNEELLQLAYFMADNYLCPVSTALKAMIPKAITNTKAQVIIPLINIDEFEQMFAMEKYLEFFKKLWQDNELTLANSKKYVNDEDLDYLINLKLIKIIYKYTKKFAPSKRYIYSIKENPTEKEGENLKKRAPRQAEILQLVQRNSIPCELLEKEFSKATINALIKKNYITKELVPTSFRDNEIVLTEEQATAINTVSKFIGKEAQEFLLFGVTGSGKTEVYINIAKACIEKGQTVLMLIPEIALTRHLVEVISERISKIAVLHSNMSNGERLAEWESIKNGEVSLVLGTRSAIFAPIPNLGLIIIDEEQEATYKQEETPKYDAREIARERASYNNAILLYGSATPSLELFYKVQKNELFMLRLDKRIGNAKLPNIHIEDMRLSHTRTNTILSPYLQEQIEAKLKNNEQTILFINRRGYSPVTICRNCGNLLTCPNCSVGLNYHKDSHLNICHYCNFKAELQSNCPDCDTNYLQQIGTGTQKVEEEVTRLFPHANIARLDLDISRKGMQQKLLTSMKNKEIDILIGTQMVAKGLDFPNVSLVGIIDADSMLALPDYRAGERTFQLIVQAAGRAGRGDKPGEVIIQTFSPDNNIIKWAAQQDYIAFYGEELKFRKILNYPPFTNILRIVISSTNLNYVVEKVQLIGELINEITDAKEDYLQILGPAPCPIQKISNRYRYQIILKSDNMLLLKSIGYYINTEVKFPNGRIELDINPNTMM